MLAGPLQERMLLLAKNRAVNQRSVRIPKYIRAEELA